MIKVGVLGASGYVGTELLGLLARHPAVDVAYAQSKSRKGERVGLACAVEAGGRVKLPYAGEAPGLAYGNPSLEELNACDLVFLALPQEESLAIAPALTTRVIDLSPAHRFEPGYVYGLPEANRDRLKGAKRVANPGCYATACILGALPLAGCAVDYVAFDCKSGYSGGGRTRAFGVEENLVPYQVNSHYQMREVEEFVKAPFSFAPHVVNAFRGLVATIHVFGEVADVSRLYGEYYAREPFVKIVDSAPDFAAVRGTPRCLIWVQPNGSGSCVVVSAIDNLLKGAASQAVQNMNLALGFDETLGLIGRD